VPSPLPTIDAAEIRTATTDDIADLVAIEERCFSADKISRRQFRYLLTKARAVTLLFQDSGRMEGYATIFLNAKASLARVYSIAVLPDRRGKGIARRLALAGESLARAKGITRIRLEIRSDNTPSIALFRSLGYRPIKELKAYYEDGADGWRYEKNLSAADVGWRRASTHSGTP